MNTGPTSQGPGAVCLSKTHLRAKSKTASFLFFRRGDFYYVRFYDVSCRRGLTRSVHQALPPGVFIFDRTDHYLPMRTGSTSEFPSLLLLSCHFSIRYAADPSRARTGARLLPGSSASSVTGLLTMPSLCASLNAPAIPMDTHSPWKRKDPIQSRWHGRSYAPG